MRRLLLASSITAILAGCGADKQSYDTLPRDIKEIAVKDLKTEGRWFYVPTTGAAPRFAINQFPFLQGMGRYAEVCFSERGLEVRNYDSNYPDATLPKDANGYCIPQPSNAVGSDKQTNFSHILTIPGDFAAYRCQEDRYGDCVNKEEANKDANLPFRANTHFTPKPEDLLIAELNWEDFYGIREGISEIGKAELISWEFDPKAGVLNFEIERTFQIDKSKIGSFINWSTRAGLRDAIEDGAFKSRFHYSLVHETQLASANYQPIPYAVKDENDIGFFTTSSKVLNPITNRYDRTATYLNRFNPNAPIEYYLSDSFFDPKNKLFLDSTLETIDLMNKTLRLIEPDSGKPEITIVNRNKPMNIHPGDLRYNVINLIDEPLANGLLGYGPSVSHPLTGEIIKAHVNQYSGVARAGVPMYWNNLVRFYNRSQLEKSLTDRKTIEQATENSQQAISQELEIRLAQQTALQLDASRQRIDVSGVYMNPKDTELHATQYKQKLTLPTSPFNKLDEELTLDELIQAEENRLASWSENNIYPVEASWVSATSKTLLDNLPLTDEGFYTITTNENGTQTRQLKRWSELPKHLQQQAADAITVTTYATTLVHEIGHNLGLRHNFKGSNDSDNFYTAEEALKLGLNNIPAYSSIMDYAPSMLDQLPTWGKYDLAAFKFAYGRKVDVIAPEMAQALFSSDDTGQVSSLIDCTLSNNNALSNQDTLYTCDLSRFDKQHYQASQAGEHHEKFEYVRYGALHYINQLTKANNMQNVTAFPYQFCTDGNVALNSDCNRFDEGTNLTEIVQYSWQRYLDGYDTRNAGVNGVTSLFNSDYPRYIMNRASEMNQIREMLEDLESIDYRLQRFAPVGAKPTDFIASYCANEDNKDAWFCDRSQAAQLAAQFFLDVLRTPEHQCVLSNSAGTSRVESFGVMLNAASNLIPASYDITKASCFDSVGRQVISSFASGFSPIAETENGRFINSINSFDPDAPWSNAVSALGIWPDKLIASQMLARRYSLRNTNEVSFANLLDLLGVKAQFDEIMLNLVAKQPLLNPVRLIDAQGQAYSLPANSSVTVNLHKTELIESLPFMTPGLARDLDISIFRRQNLAETMLSIAARHMYTNDWVLRSRATAQADSWTKQLPHLRMSNDGIDFDINGKTYVATKSNTIAQRFAKKMVDSEGYDLKLALDKIDNDTIHAKVEKIEAAWQGVLTDINPIFHSPIAALNPSLIEIFYQAEQVQEDETLGGIFLRSLLLATETGVLQGLGNADNGFYDLYQNRTNEKTFELMELYTIFQRSRTFYNSPFVEQFLPALQQVYTGHQSAKADEKWFWTTDFYLLNAYVKGDLDQLLGENRKVLDSLPVAGWR
ncbi:zinc-dependent metalloprotease [Vibrio metschnikovii]|uniref:zinc-dependent metalloprotease n=1 Tax=Vibrio metschnikovii TaxID=28172 RepID=UPI001646BD14|nr:zinc-dependent metalloprotease [Vibrio metschnikovii]MBC3619501.1 zinc-dependent metalloprotease [Vibrio metschnikovii]